MSISTTKDNQFISNYQGQPFFIHSFSENRFSPRKIQSYLVAAYNIKQ